MTEKPSLGVKVDCERLLRNFSNSGNNYLYKDFVKEWQKMKFSLIYRGRSSVYELVQLTEEALLIAKAFLFPPYSTSERIGAIFLLYGLYYRQPTYCKKDCFVKIRITYDEWISVTEFVTKLKENNHLDACFIYYKMIVDEAFHFVCFSRLYGIVGKTRLKETYDELVVPSELPEEHSTKIMSTLLQECDFHTSWKEKEEEYNRIKKSLIDDQLVDKVVKCDTIGFIENLTASIIKEEDDHNREGTGIGGKRRALKNRKAGANIKDGSAKLNTLGFIRNQMIDEENEKRLKLMSLVEAPKKKQMDKSKYNAYLKRRILYVNECDSDSDNDDNDSDDTTSNKDTEVVLQMMTKNTSASKVGETRDLPSLIALDEPSVSNPSTSSNEKPLSSVAMDSDNSEVIDDADFSDSDSEEDFDDILNLARLKAKRCRNRSSRNPNADPLEYLLFR